jgi:actin-related protein
MKARNMAVVVTLMLGSALAAMPVWAAKPDAAGEGARTGVDALQLAQRQQGGPANGAGAGRSQAEERMREERRTPEQMREQAERQQEQAREERERAQEQARERREDGGPPDSRGMEQQRERVMEQEQRELGRGSEQGQEAREQRRKWWRFWDRSED